MAKATRTIKQVLNYQDDHAAWFAANQVLFNQLAAFYFEVIQAHENVLALSNTDALTALEKLTHTTKKNPTPAMPLSVIGEDIPALFRRAALSIVVKVWTGRCWSWIKVRITGRELPVDVEMGSPSLIRRGNQWWLHTPLEKQLSSPPTIEKQVTANAATKICAVDLNMNEHVAVCTIQTVEGTILATRFIGGGREISGFRKKLLGWIARNRRKTGIIAKSEQDNVHLWEKINHVDDHFAHLVSARIVQFAKQHEASILVFEHLGNLKPTRGKYSHQGNSKRAFWMKGRIFKYAKYKAYHEGLLTSRVNPRNTSRECAGCHNLVARYKEGQPAAGYTSGAPLVFCAQCGMRGNAERNLQVLQPAKTPEAKRDHLFLKQGMQIATSMAPLKMGRSGWMSTYQIFLTHYDSHVSRSHATPTQGTDYVGVSEAAGLETPWSVTYMILNYSRRKEERFSDELSFIHDWARFYD